MWWSRRCRQRMWWPRQLSWLWKTGVGRWQGEGRAGGTKLLIMILHPWGPGLCQAASGPYVEPVDCCLTKSLWPFSSLCENLRKAKASPPSIASKKTTTVSITGRSDMDQEDFSGTVGGSWQYTSSETVIISIQRIQAVIPTCRFRVRPGAVDVSVAEKFLTDAFCGVPSKKRVYN